MNKIADSLGVQELRYFSKMSASISHELKNVLATLNENAGLLQDLSAMVEHGGEFNPERIKRLSSTMLNQISRGDLILKRMNQFAHSADNDCTVVDLNALVSMVVELFERTAMTRGVSIDMSLENDELPITTNPFALETLLGCLLDRLTDREQIEDKLIIRVDIAEAYIVTLTGITRQHLNFDKLFTDNVTRLVELLAIIKKVNRDDGEIQLVIPKSIKCK